MAITSTSALTAALPGQRLNIFKQMSSALGTNWLNKWISLWRYAGDPTNGVTPATQNGLIPTSATTGAPAFSNAGGSNTLYLGRCAPVAPTDMTLVLYDRLLHASGFTNTASPASPAVVNRTAPGDAGVFKNELWLEAYGPPSATRNISVTYTDQDGNTGNVSTTVQFAGSVPNLMVRVPLAAGDIGVKSVQTVTCDGATGGDFGFTILRQLAQFTIPARLANVQDAITLGMPDVPSNACLALMMLASTNSPGDVICPTQLIQG